MMRLLVIFLFFLFVNGGLIAQEKNKGFVIETYSGFEVGWWIYNRGSSVDGVFNNQGWDRSHFAVKIPFGLDLLYKIEQWKIGVGGNYSLLIDDEMEQFEDSFFLDREYRISEGAAVKFLSLAVVVERNLYQNKNYSLGPNIRAGYFSVETIHPERDNFGRKLFWELGVNNEIRIANIQFIVRPKYQAMVISPRQEKFKNEKHHIFGLGIALGARFLL